MSERCRGETVTDGRAIYWQADHERGMCQCVYVCLSSSRGLSHNVAILITGLETWLTHTACVTPDEVTVLLDISINPPVTDNLYFLHDSHVLHSDYRIIV